MTGATDRKRSDWNPGETFDRALDEKEPATNEKDKAADEKEPAEGC